MDDGASLQPNKQLVYFEQKKTGNLTDLACVRLEVEQVQKDRHLVASRDTKLHL